MTANTINTEQLPRLVLLYSHKDEAWKGQGGAAFATWVRAARLTLFDDRQLTGIANWQGVLKFALEKI